MHTPLLALSLTRHTREGADMEARRQQIAAGVLSQHAPCTWHVTYADGTCDAFCTADRMLRILSLRDWRCVSIYALPLGAYTGALVYQAS